MTELKSWLIDEGKQKNKNLTEILCDYAQKACQLVICTHPAKFSHPEINRASVTNVISTCNRENDGYFRSGNVNTTFNSEDAYGNAAAIPVYKFLSQAVDDISVLEHIEQETKVGRTLLGWAKGMEYSELRSKFLRILPDETKSATHGRIKQVFFPVGEDYHLLSVMTPSVLMFETKNRIDNSRTSESAKNSRERRKKGELCETGYISFPGLSEIKFGGTKPQNISILNSNYNGRVLLLSSVPPIIKIRDYRLPKHNFFYECIRLRDFKSNLYSLHKIFANPQNNVELRNKRDRILLNIFDNILSVVLVIRDHDQGWSVGNDFNRLPKYQKHVLDSTYTSPNHMDNNQIDIEESIVQFVLQISRWITESYKRLLRKNASELHDDEILQFFNLFMDYNILKSNF